MTFEEYKAESQRRQLAYCAEESAKMDQLLQLWYDYKAKAHALGYHPLERSEIIARKDELRGMAARVDETHGDNLRRWYDTSEHAG